MKSTLKYKSYIKVLFFNILFFLLFIIIFEIIFGYFLKKNNFGYLMRSERQKNQVYEVIHNNQKYKFNYIRNFYGFRGDEIEPSDIKIVFEGGSTGNQKFLPENLTIVGLLNDFLLKDKIDIKIYNASTDGKTLKGYINDFGSWFSKIENLDPAFFIFYLGINDSTIFKPIWGYKSKFDTGERTGYPEKISDYIKNNSITYELLLKTYNRYFSKLMIQNNPNHIYQDLYVDYKYINYPEASMIYKKLALSEDEKYLLKYFQSQLEKLNVIIKKNDIIPIFITQIQYNGLGTKNLFLINEEIKKFATINGFYLIKLDEMINNIEKNDFYDPLHGQISASKKITNVIYPEIKKIFQNEL